MCLSKINIKLLSGFICVVILLILLLSHLNDLNDNFLKGRTKSVVSRLKSIPEPKITIVSTFVPLLRSTNVNDTSCYDAPSDVNGFLELDPTKEKDEFKSGKNIFFHETSCFGNEGLILNARQACAVESAAKMNPSMTIYLLFLSPSKISDSSNKIIQQLLSYKNIKIRRININNYMRKTPLEKWYATGIFHTSHWPRSHMSDILRYLTLWKFGGIYLDLDFVVIKSLENLNNFAGVGDSTTVYSGALGMGIGKLGRKVAEASINNLKENFRGDYWGHNGPGVITRTLQNLCKTKNTSNMTMSRCEGFMVYSPSIFYPIFYPSWRQYFQVDANNMTMKNIEKSKAIHVWNKLSKSEKIRVGSQVPYAKIAEKHCPKVYNNCGTFF